MKIGTLRIASAALLGAAGLVLLAAYALIASFLYLEPSLPTDVYKRQVLLSPMLLVSDDRLLMSDAAC